MGFKLKLPKGSGIISAINPVWGAQAAGASLGAQALGFGQKSPGALGLPAIPQFKMRNTEEFIKEQPRIEIGKGEDSYKQTKDVFNRARQRAAGQARAATNENVSALQRRFTSIGAGGTGASIKAMQQAKQAGQGAEQAAIEGVDAAEATAGLQREQMQLSRDLAQADMDFKNRVFSFERGSKLHELDLAERQQQIDSVATEINRRTAQFNTREPKKGLLSGVIDSII